MFMMLPHVLSETGPALLLGNGLVMLGDFVAHVAATNGAGPRGMAIRFYLADHVHTDIIGHSHNGFPTRTGEEFLEFARALAASGATVPKPTPLEKFFATHPRAMQFATSPNPIPTSFARESFYAVSALKFTNNAGASRFGRYQIRPGEGTEYLAPEAAAKKSANFLVEELPHRLAAGPVKLRILVQLAAEGDDVSDSSVTWPDDREQIEFGTLTLTKMEDQSKPDLRKIIFDPIPRVDGIDPSDDPLFEVRAAIYLASGRRRRAAQPASQTSV
jgi:catalase